jgi:cell division septal protein FtsQ
MFFRSKNKNQRKSLQEKSEKEKGFNFFRLVFYFLAIAFLAISVYIFIFSPYLEINQVYVQGAEELKEVEIKKLADSFLEEKYFQVIPKKNLLLASKGELEKKLKNEFKKISSVEIKKIFPDTIIISITERKALLIWCSGEACFLVDEKGFVYSPADFESAEIKENNLIIVHDQSQSEIQSERPIFKPEFGKFLIDFREKAKDALDVQFDSNFETPRAISGDLTGIASEGWKVNLNAEIEVDKEIGMLRIVMEKNIDPEKRKDLEYVDLRTEGKVYFKFKSTAPEQSSEKK